MTTSERIRTRRIELGLTQLEVAKKLGYTSKAAICKIEKQGNNVTLKTVKKIAKVLNCSPFYLMGWDEKEPEVAKVDVFISELKDITSDANEATKRAILDYAYFALERQKKGGIAHVTEEN